MGSTHGKAVDAKAEASSLAREEPIEPTLAGFREAVARTREELRAASGIGSELRAFSMYCRGQHRSTPAHNYGGVLNSTAQNVANAMTRAQTAAANALRDLERALSEVEAAYATDLPKVGLLVCGRTEAAEYAGAVRFHDGTTLGPYAVAEGFEAVQQAASESGRRLRIGAVVERTTGAGVWAEVGMFGNRMDCWVVHEEVADATG